MSEKVVTVPSIRQREDQQAINAFLSTMAPPSDVRRYPELDAGVAKYSVDLMGGENTLEELVKIGISRNKNKPFRILVLGAGTGVMAEELVEKLGQPKNLYITELGMGDPRSSRQKNYDTEHNIRFIHNDINRVDLGESSYDLVLSRMFLLHMVDPLRVVKKVARCMKSGGEFYADFKFTSDFVPRFRASKGISPEEKAREALVSARRNGSIIFIDDIGFYYKKNEKRLRFGNLGYGQDKKGRVYYKSL